MAKRARKPKSLRAELGAHPDDVIGHLDRDIPPAVPTPAPGGLSAKALALRAWIAVADGPVEVKVEDLDAILELGAERSLTEGSTFAYFAIYDRTGRDWKVRAHCWADIEGPSIDYGELQARRAARHTRESPLDVAAIAADAEIEGRTTDAEQIRASLRQEAA